MTIDDDNAFDYRLPNGMRIGDVKYCDIPELLRNRWVHYSERRWVHSRER